MSKQHCSDDGVSTRCPDLDGFLVENSNLMPINLDKFSMDYSMCDEHASADSKSIASLHLDDIAIVEDRRLDLIPHTQDSIAKVKKNRSAYNLFVKDKVREIYSSLATTATVDT